MKTRRTLLGGLVCGLTAAVLVSQTGCGIMTQLMWIAKGGPQVQAEYEGLEGKRVAVVCVADSASYGTTTAASMLARRVEAKLKTNVKEITIVPQDEIEDWKDHNAWDEYDYREVGRGVNADRVVAIDLASFRLHEGQTMYKGRAEVTVSVYDMEAGGETVFRRNVPEIAFPESGGQHTTDTTEPQFRQIFIEVLSQRVARYFFDYEFRNTVAQDAALLN
ncbi:MAG: hypothetical protein R3C99_19530 [Pirellulaceae bacterium]|nr:hypothetical protein [Planctomycetales bacterium]MCA9205678.1 hypothetical protein [Planctomycetales bacterium]MCA9222484.1 hypothetical protein [Planctomycetales bacterium]